MATIPSVTSIQRVMPTGNRPIAVVRNAGAVGEGLQQVAGAIGNVAENIDKRAKYDASMAEEEFLSRKYELDTEIENDNDYATLPQRYSEKLGKMRDEIGGKLSTPGAANIFGGRAEIHSDRGLTRAKGVAFAKENTTETLRMENALERLIETSGTDADPLMGRDVAAGILEGALENGYIIKPQYDAALKKWTDGKVMRTLKLMTPEQRIEASKQQWFKNNVPADEQASILQDARDQSRVATAIDKVDQWRSKGLSLSAMYQQIDKVGDPKLRDSMRTEAAQSEARSRSMRNATQGDLVDKYYNDVSMGKRTVLSIPESDRRAMGNSLASLLAAENGAASAIGRDSPYPKYSDPVAIDTILGLLDSDPQGAREYFNANRDKFKEADYEAYSKATQGDSTTEVKSFLSIQQRIANKVGTGKSLTKRRDHVEVMVDQWYQTWQVNHPGKVPDTLEIDKTIDAALMDRPIEREILWDTTEMVANIEGADLGYQRLLTEDKEFAKRLRETYPDYTETQLFSEYNRLMRIK